MDLIYSDASFVDIGVLTAFSADFSFGESENNFEVKIDEADHCCAEDYFLWIEGTDYGGIIDSISTSTSERSVTYSGRTWHGMIGSKILEPLRQGETASEGITIKEEDEKGSLVDRFLTISGSVDNCLRFLIKRAGLTELFEVEPSGIDYSFRNHQFTRFPDYYEAIVRMLRFGGMKLKVRVGTGRIFLKAAIAENINDSGELSDDKFPRTLKRKYNQVNHLVCLGSGWLEDRIVHHLYCDANGVISENQTFFGMDEYAEVYEDSNNDDLDSLIDYGTRYFQRIIDSAITFSVSCTENEDSYDIGSVIQQRDEITGTDIEAVIVQKIVTVNDGITTISYKVGDMNVN